MPVWGSPRCRRFRRCAAAVDHGDLAGRVRRAALGDVSPKNPAPTTTRSVFMRMGVPLSDSQGYRTDPVRTPGVSRAGEALRQLPNPRPLEVTRCSRSRQPDRAVSPLRARFRVRSTDRAWPRAETDSGVNEAWMPSPCSGTRAAPLLASDPAKTTGVPQAAAAYVLVGRAKS